MPACTLSPGNKRALAKAVGDDLLKHYGKKPYYSPQEVQDSRRRQAIDFDVSCWAHALFNSPEDFRLYHESIGEACDYVARRSEMISSLVDGGGFNWLDIDLSWLDWPDIDLSGIFDWFDVS